MGESVRSCTSWLLLPARSRRGRLRGRRAADRAGRRAGVLGRSRSIDVICPWWELPVPCVQGMGGSMLTARSLVACERKRPPTVAQLGKTSPFAGVLSSCATVCSRSLSLRGQCGHRGCALPAAVAATVCLQPPIARRVPLSSQPPPPCAEHEGGGPFLLAVGRRTVTSRQGCRSRCCAAGTWRWSRAART